MKILLIIPAYNEESNIVRVVGDLQQHYPEYDYVVVNDGSRDNTESELKSCNANHIMLIQNLGIGGAVQTGYKYAYENGYDIAVQMDGDGQHDVRCVKDIIAPIERNEADLVIGSRFVKESSSGFRSSFLRRMGIGIISAVIRLKTGKRIFDTTSGFRAVNRKLIKEFAADYPTEYPEPVSSTFALKSGYAISEVPVQMHERSAGVSSIRTWKNLYYMVNVVLSILLLKGTKSKNL